MAEASPDAAARSVVVGVDLGGTKIAAATVAADGTLGPVRAVPTPAAAGPDAVLDAVAGLVREVVAALPGGARLRGLGVGTAGVVDVGRGVIVSATDTLPGWPGTDVAGGLRRRLADLASDGPSGDAPAVPVFVENDVDAHAAGEVWLGAAAGARSALLVAVGTGVGAAVVLDGRPLRGAHHVAGELGHMPVPGAELLRCPCGRTGHLEAIGAGPAIHRRYLALGGDAASPDTRDVVARAGAGDELAATVVRDAAQAVGRAVAGVVTVLDPEVVVVGGGLAGAGDLWWSALEGALRAEVVDVLADLPLRRAALGNEAAIVGAARGAWSLVGPSGDQPGTRPGGLGEETHRERTTT
ncbi:ROK family protein [Cellulosimicrobium protaetiae]|uniref:ROK family protein n=1 Tax=Cellulosimicrobium protaetiae TaxID=2587808 RepID=A0A6M5UEH6_9MICO|nr:ROK family protein [Cellulosimicrobium protaetiae]QJW35059.1 ROK family protein [Cellulosimicrobium protaetiae]